MTVKLLTEHHLELLSLKGGCTGSPESTLVEMPHCWKSHVVAHIFGLILYVPVNSFSVMSGWVFLGLTSTKQRIKCLAQGHNMRLQ